jgi:hypothetical protein
MSSPAGVGLIKPQSFKTMIRFGAQSYRVTRLRFSEYEIVRIVDDQQLGVFRSFPRVEVVSATIHPAFVLKIACAAARGTRAGWLERLALAWRRCGSLFAAKGFER